MVLSPQSQGQVITLLKRREGGGDKLVSRGRGSCSYYKSVSWDQVLFIEILIYIFIKKTV